MLNPTNGAILKKLSTGVGTDADPSGLSTIRALRAEPQGSVRAPGLWRRPQGQRLAFRPFRSERGQLEGRADRQAHRSRAARRSRSRPVFASRSTRTTMSIAICSSARASCSVNGRHQRHDGHQHAVRDSRWHANRSRTGAGDALFPRRPQFGQRHQGRRLLRHGDGPRLVPGRRRSQAGKSSPTSIADVQTVVYAFSKPSTDPCEAAAVVDVVRPRPQRPATRCSSRRAAPLSRASRHRRGIAGVYADPGPGRRVGQRVER